MGEWTSSYYSSLTWNEGNKRLTHLLHNASGKHKGSWSQWQWFSWSIGFPMFSLQGDACGICQFCAFEEIDQKSPEFGTQLITNCCFSVAGLCWRKPSSALNRNGWTRRSKRYRVWWACSTILWREDKQPRFPPNKSSKPVTESSKDYWKIWKIWKWWFLATVFPSS